MLLASVPTKVPLPFANSGTKNVIPTASQIGITAGAASLTDGFPPLTFTALTSGGVPPKGADFNGILNLLSQTIQWNNAGGFFPYDSTFSTAIGGYPLSAVLARADGTGFWLSTEDNNAADPETDISGAWQPINNTGVSSVALAAANVVLTSLQYAKRIVILTGALTANVSVTFPAFAGLEWLIVNNTTGAFTVTCTTAGTGFVLAQGQSQGCYTDGTNLIPSFVTLGQVLNVAPVSGSAYTIAGTSATATSSAIVAPCAGIFFIQWQGVSSGAYITGYTLSVSAGTLTTFTGATSGGDLSTFGVITGAGYVVATAGMSITATIAITTSASASVGTGVTIIFQPTP